MKPIHLNILGLKNFETGDLIRLRDEIELLRPTYSSLLWEPVGNLKRKIQLELAKRERSKYVWVQFESYWSGYTSAQRKLVGRYYRKIKRSLATHLPNWFSHQFTDNTTNDWLVKVVSVRGKDEGSYPGQIDTFLKEQSQTNPQP